MLEVEIPQHLEGHKINNKIHIFMGIYCNIGRPYIEHVFGNFYLLQAEEFGVRHDAHNNIRLFSVACGILEFSVRSGTVRTVFEG